MVTAMTDEEFAELEAVATGPCASFETLVRYADAIQSRYERQHLTRTAPDDLVYKTVEHPPPVVHVQPDYVTQEQLRNFLDFIADEIGAAIGRMQQLMDDESKFTRETLEQLRKDLLTKGAMERADLSTVLRGSVGNKGWKRDAVQ